MFGLSRASHIDFLEKSSISFKHLFLKDWTSGMETMPYPPSSGAFAIYTIPSFYESVNYAMKRVNQEYMHNIMYLRLAFKQFYVLNIVLNYNTNIDIDNCRPR